MLVRALLKREVEAAFLSKKVFVCSTSVVTWKSYVTCADNAVDVLTDYVHKVERAGYRHVYRWRRENNFKRRARRPPKGVSRATFPARVLRLRDCVHRSSRLYSVGRKTSSSHGRQDYLVKMYVGIGNILSDTDDSYSWGGTFYFSHSGKPSCTPLLSFDTNQSSSSVEKIAATALLVFPNNSFQRVSSRHLIAEAVQLLQVTPL